MTSTHALTPADIMPYAEYAKVRVETRRKISERKKNRRLEVGPNCAFYFECRDTMWLQVQEMLHIEKGGAEQLKEELEAYNPLIPAGSELVATFMIEIDDPVRRKHVLSRLGGVEEKVFLQIGERVVRTSCPSGRTSVCNISSALNASLSNRAGQSSTSAHQMSAGCRRASQ